MLGRAIRRFTDNLSALREFVEVTKPFLDERKNEVLKGRAEDLAPILLAMDSVSSSDLGLTEEQRVKIRDHFDGDIELAHEDNGEGRGKVSLTVNGPGQQRFSDAMERLRVSEHHSHLLHGNSLIALVSAAEWFLSEIFHYHFEVHPDSAGIKDKSLTLKELMAIGNIEEAQRYLIDIKVEEILRGSFEEWITFLKEKLKLSMGYMSAEKEKMIEVYQRRHLLIHNGGNINQIYLNKVNEDLWASDKLDYTVTIPKQYLDDAIDTFERVLTLIAFELWKKTAPEDEERGSMLIQLAFEKLKQQKWAVAEGLSFFLTNDKALPERDQTIGQLNYWQAVKWQGRFEDVSEDIEKADYSAKDELFKLAQFSLLDDATNFFALVPVVLAAEKCTLEDLQTWPIFRSMRDDSRFEKYSAEAVEEDTGSSGCEIGRSNE